MELANKNFHSPEESSNQLGFPIVGYIPFITAGKKLPGAVDSKLDPMLCAFHQPGSHFSEAYRAVRTSLYFSTGAEGQKVIQVTSPAQGEGKSMLVANLAISIARSEKKVLLIDADFRRSRIHKLFNLDCSVGTSSVLNGDTALHDAIQSTQIENLWIMTSGPTPHNPSELLTSPRFQQLLDDMRDKFDFLLIDSPPLLSVTDPAAIAVRVDGVLLTIRITKNARLDAVRATKTLADLGANMLGIVVNGIHGERRYGYEPHLYANAPHTNRERDFNREIVERPLSALMQSEQSRS